LVLGLLLQGIASWLNSSFLEEFLADNLITLLLALLAINATTLSVILTKLQEIVEEHQADFSRTIRAMKRSIIEQIALVSLASIALVLKESTVVQALWGSSDFVLNVMLIAVFICALHILYDTANGVFVILHGPEPGSV
jgi:hypothetical protein